jgi:hypothetical protein
LSKKPKKDLKNSKKTDVPKNKQIIPWVVFLFSISIVLISFTSVMFPALILVSDTVRIPGVDPVTPDPFETGVWSGGVVIASVITFGLAILHFKNKLPNSFSSFFERLFAFEISKKVALIVMIVLLAIYISISFKKSGTNCNDCVVGNLHFYKFFRIGKAGNI